MIAPMPRDQFLAEVFKHFADVAGAKFDIEYLASMSGMSDAECLAMTHAIFNDAWPPRQVDMFDEASSSWPADHIIADGYADHYEFARRITNEFQWHYERLKNEAERRNVEQFSMTASVTMRFLSDAHSAAHVAETRDIWHTMTWKSTDPEPINWLFDIEDVFEKALKKYVQTEFEPRNAANRRGFSAELVAEYRRQKDVIQQRRARRTGGIELPW